MDTTAPDPGRPDAASPPAVADTPAPEASQDVADGRFWSGVWQGLTRPVRRLIGARDPEPRADAPARRPAPKRKVRVLFVDVGNSTRSQVAQAFATIYGFHAESAGTFPSLQVALEAVAAMREVGIDISGFRPKPLDTSRLEAFDRVITFGDPLPGPYRHRPQVEEWNVIDPHGLSMEGYERMRNDIERRVKAMARRYRVKQPDLVALES